LARITKLVLSTAALALSALSAAPAYGQATDPPAPQDPRNASPSVLLGDRIADKLCLFSFTAATTVLRVAGGRTCGGQGHQRLHVNRARYAQVTLGAATDQLSAGWAEAGRLLRPLAAVRTGELRWNVTVPPTSGRLVLSVAYGLVAVENGAGQPPMVAPAISNDWKISVRRPERR
jgi:hypothetical protein